ncbi:MAG: 16S rRNA (cytosine(1402)-N(4))-methyltransferase RsmH [Cyclobacteriaceae bacterium]
MNNEALKYHTPVMLNECMEGLALNRKGTYVDVTFGGGGHSKEILNQLNEESRLIGFDQDTDAAKEASLITSPDFTFVKANFSHLKRYLRFHNAPKIDGLLADLGISSHQINKAERGFSFRFSADLDMRMNQETEISAHEIINTYEVRELTAVFREYGELKNAFQLAHAIDRARKIEEIETTDRFTEIITPFAKRGKENRFYAQVFQAIRIEVNKEMEVLKELLLQSAEMLNKGGRLVVMTYHSLEDRLVKNFINKGVFSGEAEKDLYGNVNKPFKAINRKPITATEKELETNNRARSAKLRIAERV